MSPRYAQMLFPFRHRPCGSLPGKVAAGSPVVSVGEAAVVEEHPVDENRPKVDSESPGILLC
jgi:hypothetical protein